MDRGPESLLVSIGAREADKLESDNLRFSGTVREAFQKPCALTVSAPLEVFCFHLQSYQ